MRTALAVCVLVVSSSAVASSLDKEVIRRPIRRAMPELTKCYERQLIANPKLGEGKVSVDFMIGKAGKVIDATASGFDDAVAGVSVRWSTGVDPPARDGFARHLRRRSSNAEIPA